MVRNWFAPSSPADSRSVVARWRLRLEYLDRRDVPSGTDDTIDPPPVEEQPPVQEAPPAQETPPAEEQPPVPETPPVDELPPAPEPPVAEPTPTPPAPTPPQGGTPSGPTVDGPSTPTTPAPTAIDPTAPVPNPLPITNGPIAPTPGGKPIIYEARPRYAVSTGPGQSTQVNIYDGPTGALLGIVSPFGVGYTGGATVATGDLNGDGVEDIILGAGPGGGPWVRVYDGKTLADLGAFLAYNVSFSGGVTVAVGDVNGDGVGDVVTGAGAGGGPHVQVFSGKTLLPSANATVSVLQMPMQSYFAYNPMFTGGVSVASGDTDGDGFSDVVTGAGAGGGPHVKIFSGTSGTELQSFFAYDGGYTVGLFVAAGDLDGDGKAEVIAGVADGPSRVRVYEGKTLKNTFTVWGNGKPGGVRVGTVDITGDGIDEIIAGNGPAQFPTVKIFNPNDGTTLRESPSFVQTYTGGVFVG